MPKPRPTYLPGQYYHFYNRGRSRLPIFKEPENYIFVLRKIKHYATLFNLKLIAYCLMPNHYHFLIRQDSEYTAGLLPQRVFNSYSKAYNKRYNHSGTLFEDNYKVKPVETTAYLLHLCRYIHINPVKDGFTSDPADWPYSNYSEWVGLRQGSLYDPEFVRINFDAPANYRAFVFADLLARNLPEDVKKYIESLDEF
jgi:REP element-mobilizing transposase RayT